MTESLLYARDAQLIVLWGLLMSFIVAALIVSAQTAAADAPQAAAPVATPAAVPEKSKKPKLICKREDADSGSHMSRRTCLTAEQWNGGGADTSSSHSGTSISGEEYQRGH